MSELTKKHCVPCEGGVPPLQGEFVARLKEELDPAWEVVEEKKLRRLYRFPNFVEGLQFVNEVGEIAEKEGHHPDLLLSWGKVEVTLFTHSIGGLSENDFILAAKIEEQYKKRTKKG